MRKGDETEMMKGTPGLPAPQELLVNIPQLINAYYVNQPDPFVVEQQVSFGTSGHRGVSLAHTFNERHIHAITQAIVDYRRLSGINGPLFVGMDTHALSKPAFISVVEVLAANHIDVFISEGGEYTPTPAVSHAILTYNRGRKTGLADGVIITPSHNPPDSGGIKYNPPQGGPADTNITSLIASRANILLKENNQSVMRLPFEQAKRCECIRSFDYRTPYVAALAEIVDMEAIRTSGLHLAADALGGAGLGYWAPIAERYGLDITVFNAVPDPTFRFMPLDKDGAIRMDCSSPYAMAGLIRLKDQYDLAFGNDPDFDRHGIVTKTSGLMNPNHYLAAVIDYLFRTRVNWPTQTAVGKTLVSSAIIDRVAAGLKRNLFEVPVGFKWFVDGLLSGQIGFGGEESAGASFLRRDGRVWTTDKDGIILCLLAAEMTAVTGKDPGAAYQALTRQYGAPVYARLDAPASRQQKALLSALSAKQVVQNELTGELILAKLTCAPGNHAPIGGLKVVTENGWFAARPSGTEDVYKIYAESFKGEPHLKQIQAEAQAMVSDIFRQQGM